MRTMLCGILAAGCFAGCASIPLVHLKPDYQDLPSDALREVALEIEQAVQAGERDPALADRNGIVLTTDVIKQAIRTRAARIELLGKLLDAGFAREARNGLVEILPSKQYKQATTRRDRDRNALLVYDENSNRWALYEGILAAGNFPPRALSAVQEVFHEARIRCLTEGQVYESPMGETVPKGRE